MNTFIVKAKRTAIGKFGGSLSKTDITNITAQLIKKMLSDFDNHETLIDEVILGNALPAGLGQNPARIIAIKAGISPTIPAVTINSVCGSSLKSIIIADQSIRCGDSQFILSGGFESMSRCPYYLDDYRFGVKFGNFQIKDGMIQDGLFCNIINAHMGITAENIAKKYSISREDQDKFALESQTKAIKSINEKSFSNEIIPIYIENSKETFVFSEDEQPRKDTTLDALSKLRPAFLKDGSVTAGNSSTINDGAASVLIASKKAVNDYELTPLVKIISHSFVGVDPKLMGLGAFYAAKKCLQKVNMKPKDIDIWEINEAFSAQAISVINLLKIDPKKVNQKGGAIALGHPIGASGCRILVTLIHILKEKKLRYGLATACIGGGQGVAILVENI